MSAGPEGAGAKRWSPLPSTRIGGLKIATASRAGLAEAMVADCTAARAAGFPHPPRLIFDANGHAVSLRQTDAAFREAIARADVIHADGGFLVTFSKWFRATPIAERSVTTDMIHDLAEQARTRGLSFYLLGGTERVNAQCAAELARLYPGLRIAGRRNGYFTEAEETGVVDAINAAAPDVLWVGLGKPKEQIFAARHAGRLRAGWLVTCGGCYNYITGDYSRAPRWMQRNNLEWLYRAVTEPRKLLWRYIVTTPHALWIVATGFGRQREEG